MFLKISQNLQENNCARNSFIKNNLIEKESLAQVFSYGIAKFLRPPFLQKTSGSCFWIEANFTSAEIVPKHLENPFKFH